MSQCAGDWISWDMWVRPACQAAHPRSAVMMPCRWCLPACSPPRVQNVLLVTQTLLAEPQAINNLREDLSTTISLWLLLLLLFIYISILSYAASEHSGFSLALKLVTINFFVLTFLTVNGDNTNPYPLLSILLETCAIQIIYSLWNSMWTVKLFITYIFTHSVKISSKYPLDKARDCNNLLLLYY